MWLRSTLMLSCALVTPAAAQEIHAPHCLHGCPSGSPATNDLIFRDIYILSSNDLTKFADWVAYKVTKQTIGATAERNWKADPYLAEQETLEPDDYDRAHATLRTDRGHQVPLASFTGTEHWEDTNFLSNITPQKSDLNQGVWVKLESAERNLAQSAGVDAVYVMSGTLYEHNTERLPEADEVHMVPSGYWKIVATETDGRIETAAFIFEQDTERRADLCNPDFITSVRTIEERTGLTFFHALDPDRQEAIKTSPANLLPGLGCAS